MLNIAKRKLSLMLLNILLKFNYQFIQIKMMWLSLFTNNIIIIKVNLTMEMHEIFLVIRDQADCKTLEKCIRKKKTCIIFRILLVFVNFQQLAIPCRVSFESMAFNMRLHVILWESKCDVTGGDRQQCRHDLQTRVRTRVEPENSKNCLVDIQT